MDNIPVFYPGDKVKIASKPPINPKWYSLPATIKKWLVTDLYEVTLEDGTELIFNAGNGEIIGEEVRVRRETVELTIQELKNLVEDIGGCDHSVNICCCGLYSLITDLENAVGRSSSYYPEGI